MLNKNVPEKVCILVGITILSGGCSFVHPGFGVAVMGVGVIVMGIASWIVSQDEEKYKGRY